MDNAVCGGPDSGSGITSTASPISAAAQAQIKAVIEMGSPRYVAGLSYNVGTCTAQGVSIFLTKSWTPHPFSPNVPKY
jgi:acetylxylan esterase